MNDLIQGDAANEYHLKGLDPYIEYALDPANNALNAFMLKLQLSCNDGTGKVPMQVFWLNNEEQHYKEEQSVRFTIQPGGHLIDLRSVPGWAMNGTVNRLRLDIDSKNTCAELELANPTLGLPEGG